MKKLLALAVLSSMAMAKGDVKEIRSVELQEDDYLVPRSGKKKAQWKMEVHRARRKR